MTTISALPAPPSRADAANFSDRADALLGALPLFVTQTNAVAAETNAASLTAVNAPGTSATSTTSLAIGTGSKTLTIQTGKALAVGQFVQIANTASPTNYMNGLVTVYNSGTGSLTVAVSATGGAGTFTAWTVSLSLPQIALPLSGGVVTGPTTFSSTVTIVALTVAAGASLGGNLIVAGSSTLAAVSAGAITASGNILMSGSTPTITLGSGGATIWSPAANAMALGTSGSVYQRIYIDNNGVINVHGARGTTATLPGAGNLRIVTGSTGGAAVTTYDITDYSALEFVRAVAGSNNTIGTISVGEFSVFYNTSSDYRLKENVVPLVGALDRACLLSVKRFNFKSGTQTVDGFIAHEVQAIVPEAITGAKDAVLAIGTAAPPTDLDVASLTDIPESQAPAGWLWTQTGERPVYQGIDQAKLVPLLTAALQEAHGLIVDLTARVAALEAA